MAKKSRAYTFTTNPVMKMSRTALPLSFNRLMSVSLGKLYPMYCEEVLPGDTFKVNTNIVSRLSSAFLKVPYANLFLDTYWFFVPFRLVYKRWSEIFGDNPNGYWTNPETVTLPTVRYSNYNADSTYVSKGTVWDYLGCPIVNNSSDLNEHYLPNVNVAYTRAFGLIWNYWFRDENYMQPVNVNTGEIGDTGYEAADGSPYEQPNSRPWGVNNYNGLLPPVARMHDYFSSALPSAQKGNPVGIFNDASVPVVSADYLHSMGNPIKLGNESSSGLISHTNGFVVTDGLGTLQNETGAPFSGSTADVNASNLVADFTGVNVNDLRIAFQTQKLLERSARGGTRYAEYLLSAFGVSAPDSRLQVPEYLGGKRLTIGISQVANTSTDVGTLGAYSLSDGRTGFSKAFSEAGIILGVCCLRQFHSYSQGIHPRFTRSKRSDFYDPIFANIGEMPIKTEEIFINSCFDGQTSYALETNNFGFQEAWASYRYHPNEICGQMKSQARDSLDVWHIGDEYLNPPVLGTSFLTETPNYLDRVITVDSDVQDQFVLDIYHDVNTVRVMPARSIPGLIDHH